MSVRSAILASAVSVPIVTVATAAWSQAAASPPNPAASLPNRGLDASGTDSSNASSSVKVIRPPVRREVPPTPRRQVKRLGEDTAGEGQISTSATPGQSSSQPVLAPSAALPQPSGSVISAPSAATHSRGQSSTSGPGIITAATVAGANRTQGGEAVVPQSSPQFPRILTVRGATAAAAATTAAHPAAIDASTWSQAEIEQAKAHCAVVLKGVDAGFVFEEPIKHGECGAPAVVRLSSIGKSPEVAIMPPVQVTCDVVASLYKWMKSDVQPLARTHLGSSVVKIETMSSYSCRNAYGRTRSKLSEHGRANAMDIAGFTTGKAETAVVMTSWGMTERDIRSVAAKAEAERAAALVASAKLRSLPGTQVETAPLGLPRSPVATGSIGTIPTLPDVGRTPSFGLAPGRLGGPKSAAEGSGQAASAGAAGGRDGLPSQGGIDQRRTRFLREAHAAACKYFGTVLGPEANNEHRNHFHIDMAPRQRSNFCE